MAITASGMFGPTLEKIFLDTAGQSIEAETHNVCLVLNAMTPNYDTMDFRNDLTETTGTGYTAGGIDLTSTEFTIAGGVGTFDAADAAWPAASITARAAVGHFDTGNAATDMVLWLSNFGADATSVGGTFTVIWDAAGIWTIDYSP